jgi:hypothetical protein
LALDPPRLPKLDVDSPHQGTYFGPGRVLNTATYGDCRLSCISKYDPRDAGTNAYAFLMSQRVVTLLEDDFDGSEASETILFALDGVEYAIDLNDAHASELREVFSRFTKAARKTGGRPRTARPGSSNAREVRLWAAGQGLQVNTRGRIQADIMEKYEAAH